VRGVPQGKGEGNAGYRSERRGKKRAALKAMHGAGLLSHAGGRGGSHQGRKRAPDHSLLKQITKRVLFQKGGRGGFYNKLGKKKGLSPGR